MILLMGIAGSGKGTQGKLLAEAHGYQVISTGELLRNYGSDEQHARMQNGEILGDDEVTEMLDKALRQMDDQNRTILDGYPRTVAQSKWLLADDKKDRFHIQYILHLVTSREAAKNRIQIRARSDDNDGAIETRFNEYEQTTLPMLEYYRQIGIEIIEVDGEKQVYVVSRQIAEIDLERQQKG